MADILLLPGDGSGPEAVSAVRTVVEAACPRAEVAAGDIGFSAYEEYGEHLPYETLDLVGGCPVVVCGPTAASPDGGRDALGRMMSQMDLFAMSRTFRTLADGHGAPGVEATVWGSHLRPQTDISETMEVDGVTISKYVRASFSERMMRAARADMERSGKTRVACLSREDLFPRSSGAFLSVFESVFSDGVEASHYNVREWITEAITSPRDCEYLVVADLYTMIVEGVLAGLTGGDRLTPVKYVGEGTSLVLPGPRTVDPMDPEPISACSAVSSAAVALADAGYARESMAVVSAMKEAAAAGERPPELGGALSTAEFAGCVASRLRANLF